MSRPSPATAPLLMPRRRRYFDPVLVGSHRDLFDGSRVRRTDGERRRRELFCCGFSYLLNEPFEVSGWREDYQQTAGP